MLLALCAPLGCISTVWGTGAVDPAQPLIVATYHYDDKRTGWNKNEVTLNPTLVKSSFGLAKFVALDDQVDAQPLYVAKQNIFENDVLKGTFDTIYVATESNTIYAIDADTGTKLLTKHLGTPVASSDLPGACDNNGPQVGINSTPVLYGNKLFVVSYQKTDRGPKYFVYKIDASTFNEDNVVEVVASQVLADGRKFDFAAEYSRQRPGLVVTHGILYAAFGSFCDIRFDVSRGWIF